MKIRKVIALINIIIQINIKYITSVLVHTSVPINQKIKSMILKTTTTIKSEFFYSWNRCLYSYQQILGSFVLKFWGMSFPLFNVA